MADDTPTTNLLTALWRVSRLLIERSFSLNNRADWSEVTWELSIDGPRPTEEIHSPAARGTSIISGYVDGTPEREHGAAWTFSVSDELNGWALSRSVVLYPLQGADVPLHLPDLTFPDWQSFSEVIPGLIQELLDTPLPGPDIE